MRTDESFPNILTFLMKLPPYPTRTNRRKNQAKHQNGCMSVRFKETVLKFNVVVAEGLSQHIL